MNIVNANDEVNEFRAFLGRMITIEFNEYIFDLQSVYDLEDYEDFVLIKDDGKIVDFVNIYQCDELNFISPNFTKYDRQLEELHLLKYSFPNHILECSEYYLNPEQKEYYKCKFNSRINRNYVYKVENDVNYYVTNEKKTNILRDNFEENYFKPLDFSNLKFVNIKASDLRKFIEYYEIFGTPLWTSGEGNRIAGFYYLTFDDINDEDSHCQYLLCMNGNNIAGVIKHGIFEEYDITHQSICYIDVNSAYRRKGLSKLLMKQMNNHLIQGLPLAITNESEMGKKCHMHKLFRENINKRVYTYKELETLQFEQQITDLKKIQNKNR